MSELKTVKEHLNELKKRLMRIITIGLLLFITVFFLSEKLLIFLIKYFGLTVYSFTPFEYIRTQIALSLYLTLSLILPFIIVQLYFFAKPTIKEKTKKRAFFFFFHALNLALIGFLFGAFIFSKYSLQFFSQLPEGITAFWGIQSTIMFIILSGLAFALTAQLVIIIPVLVRTGIVDVNILKKSRAIIIMLSLVLAAIITSPDPVTQILMGGPMYLCFETGIFLSRFYKNKEETGETKEIEKPNNLKRKKN